MAFSQSTSYTPEEHLKFKVNSNVTITVASGDITLMQADAVVVGDDKYLSGGGAVAIALSAATGWEYTKAKTDMILKQAPAGMLGTASMKRVYWCDAGPNLRYNRIYHAVVPHVFGAYNKVMWQRATATLYTEVCSEADTANQETSIVVPILGSGGGGGNLGDTVWAALNGIRTYHAGHLRDVILVERDREKAKKIVSVCQAWITKQQQVHNNVSCNILSAGSASGSQTGASATGYTPQHQTASSNLSGGLLGSAHHTGQSGSQGISTWSSSSSIATRTRSRTHGAQSSWNVGEQPSTGRPSSPSKFGSSTTVNTHSWRDPQRQATGKDNDVGKSNYHMEKVAGAGYGSSSTSSSHAPRPPLQQSTSFDEDLGNSNYHMEKVSQTARERRRAGKERAGLGHSDVMAARWTEKSFGGRESQGHTSGHHGDDPEHQHSHRRRHRDPRHITAMEVDEDPEPPSGFTRNLGEPELQGKSKPSLNSPKIVMLTNSSGESSDDETSPHPGTDHQTRTDRWESGTPAHLSKTGSHQAASPRTEPSDTRVPTETQGHKGSKKARNLLEENFPSLCSSVGLSGTGSNSSASKENFGRYRTSGSPASRTFSSISKPEENSYGTQDRGYSSPGSPSLSTTSSNWGRGDTSGRHGATGNQSSPLCSSMGAIEGRHQFLPDREFASLGSPSRSSSSWNWEGDGISGHQGKADSQPSSQLSMSITEGRQRSGQNRDFGNMRPLSHSGAGSTLGSFEKSPGSHRSLSFDDEHLSSSPSGCNVRGIASTSAVSRQTSRGESYGKEGATAGNGSAETSAWETIEERTESSPDGKMVVTRNNRIQLDGCSVLVLEFSFPNGVQGPQHPHPDQPYKGTFRRAFLPDNRQGREVLGVLRQAFRRNLVFAIWNGSNEDLVETEPDINLLTSHRDHCDSGYLEKLRSVLSQKMSS